MKKERTTVSTTLFILPTNTSTHTHTHAHTHTHTHQTLDLTALLSGFLSLSRSLSLSSSPPPPLLNQWRKKNLEKNANCASAIQSYSAGQCFFAFLFLIATLPPPNPHFFVRVLENAARASLYSHRRRGTMSNRKLIAATAGLFAQQIGAGVQPQSASVVAGGVRALSALVGGGGGRSTAAARCVPYCSPPSLSLFLYHRYDARERRFASRR
jgi:hypothetical protein